MFLFVDTGYVVDRLSGVVAAFSFDVFYIGLSNCKKPGWEVMDNYRKW